jgi:integrase
MLTESKIKSLKPSDKMIRLSDYGNLYIVVKPTGTKTFRLDTIVNGNRKTLTLGQYPDLSLRDAREIAQETKKNIRSGVTLKQKDKPSTMFRDVALQWGEVRQNNWNPKHKNYRRLEIYIYPFIGNMDITTIRSSDILKLLRPIEAKNTLETCHRVLNIIGQIFRFAIASDMCESDVTQALRGALKTPIEGHMKAITDAKEFKATYPCLDKIPSVITRSAVKMAILTAVRPGELRAMKWSDINFDAKQWSYLITKTRQDHVVPLSTQAIDILREVKRYTGNGVYVFSSLRGADRDRPLSDTALLMALQRVGIDSTVHGFRASFRTIMDEILGVPPHLLEHQLGHLVKDTLGRAYNRTSHLPQRIEMMQKWGDYLQSGSSAANLLD